MRCLACLIPCVLPAAAVEFLMWSKVESNPPECGECGEFPNIEVTADEINQCLTKVPTYCEYQVFAHKVPEATTVCPSSLGFSFEDFTAPLPTATAEEIRGATYIQLESATGTCELTYHMSETEQCVSSPTGPGATVTATDGVLEIDLSTLVTPLKFINFEASGPECGTKFLKVTFDGVAALLVTGTGTGTTATDTAGTDSTAEAGTGPTDPANPEGSIGMWAAGLGVAATYITLLH
eukprot:Gregarina_sp_Pseudo_9__2023@NODE_2400_length_1007_cov_874_564050_g2208_i0_p1_GENE_NODE_2400_length_1007_cov_874_564050_g2208_i0NODE_2400_length_1007_cov_874_564050_g2208_i0_p1_ORF_typecomplete_len237_score33_09UPF0547/PF10571_9/4e02UPF0547/PF10571_9/1_3e03UPF0547/PF10571_9/11UPF0547/PF10571_9/1_3e02_NODE_2400_length_1007_cov_874_564050_g2208_i068778